MAGSKIEVSRDMDIREGLPNGTEERLKERP